MSDLYAPFTPTPGGAVIGAQIGAYYRWVYIKNSSNYDLLYSLMPDEPTTITNYRQWSGRIEPGHGAIITIPSQIDPVSPQWQADKHGAFGGTIWLALLNYSNMLALNGTASAANNVWITGYFEWEGYPFIDASLANGSQYQQQRQIAVPIAVLPSVGTFQFTAGASVLMTPAQGLSATNIANNLVNIYVYGGILTAEHSNSAFMAIDLNVVVTNAALSVLASVTVAKYDIWSQITNNTHDTVPVVNGQCVYFAPINLTGLVSPAFTTVQLHCTAIGGTAPQGLTYTIAWGADNLNLGTPWPIGSLALAYAPAGGGNGPY